MTVLEGGCRVSEMHDGESIERGTVRIWKQIGRTTGAEAISLRVMEFAPGLSPGIQNEECDQILFVREDWGEVSTTRVSGWIKLSLEDRSYEVRPNAGIYIRPGETFAINNSGANAVTVISCQCPDPDRETQFVDRWTPSSLSTSRDQSPIVSLDDRPAQPTADRWYRVLVDDEVGSTQATQFVGSIPPGRAPDHFHHYEEVLFILKGQGRMWAGETNTPIAPGSCIYLPKGQVHCVENTGTGELRLLGVFYPAGSPSVRYES